ncbi:MAG: prepilin-type N-terminal cleavage/methylation domain-containing protein [Deltaproteobacteria bacterium]|nr:prepilin-type N-terminal cleavage/methylation domain-containing protein [Deltaproteobacteria bacterium]
MRNEKGFTLIELLVVVAIIGILAAIAIPQFAEYRVRAFNSAAVTDIRNSVTAQEAAFVDNEEYQTCADAAACEGVLPGFSATRDSAGVPAVVPFSHTAKNSAAGVANGAFDAAAQHTKGDTAYAYDSLTGTLS